MRKETIVAIVFGVILGLLVAFFMIFNLKRLEGKNAKTLNQPNVTPSVKNLKVLPLQILAPQEDSITSKDSTTIKGKADKQSLIIIQSPSSEKIFQNKNEEFSASFPLAFGENVISVTVYPKNSKLSTQQKAFKIYYLDEQ